MLQALAQGHKFGFDIMDVTNLPSGTVYPALRRLESQALVRSDWETDKEARENARPRRRYYELTETGKRAAGRRRVPLSRGVEAVPEAGTRVMAPRTDLPVQPARAATTPGRVA